MRVSTVLTAGANTLLMIALNYQVLFVMSSINHHITSSLAVLTRAHVKASKAKAAHRHTREVQFLARHDDSEDSFYTDDFSDT